MGNMGFNVESVWKVCGKCAIAWDVCDLAWKLGSIWICKLGIREAC